MSSDELEISNEWDRGDVVVRADGRVLNVDIRYPKRDAVPSVVIGLEDVRAVDDITVTFDFKRNGWVITRDVYIEHDGWMEETGEVREVAFVEDYTLASGVRGTEGSTE